ncbi:MDR family MFS transporter [Marinovum sp. 2_MG-2023]|uniref:MDR family MFS transporter n=1 Tax=unclassified Marinovum TaxID=2647166 RepID=UPI0026E2FBF2|nr:MULTISPECIES: MDR family MFS transporter [unclassified Marinovum]MDO6730887.1 MDR family MFS transporter [Marinovum sp. 2_MG-2023]MDO6780114.1 MDR family MFS transporter [Marinovum sp. 1_MG-2023]
MSTATTQNPTDVGANRYQTRIALAAVAVTLLFASLGQTIVTTAIPVMVADLGGMENMTWVITAYLLASTIGAPVAGKLGDLYGRKMVVQLGIFVFLAGATLAGLAYSMEVLIAGRVIQGLGGGGLIVVSMAIVADVLPARQRGQAQGMMGAVFGISTVIGPLFGGFLVEALSWHWIFFANFPIGLLALVVLHAALPDLKRNRAVKLDIAGAILLAVLLSVAVLVSNLGGSVLAWGSAEMLGMIGLGLAALAGFIVVESRAAEPVLPLSLFRNNTFLVVNTVGFMVGVAMFSTITFMPLYLQVVQGVTPAVSGLFLTPMMVGLIASSAGAGRVMSRTGRYKWMPVLSTALLALAMLALSTLSVGSSLWVVALSMVLVGLGLGPVFSIGIAAIQNDVPRHMLGVGTASANMFRLIGGSVGTAAFGALFSANLTQNLAGHLPDTAGQGIGSISAELVSHLPVQAQHAVFAGFSNALHPVFWIAAGLAAVACLVSLRLREIPMADTAVQGPA